YSCDMAAEDYFYGFTVWRRLGSNPFPIDTCTTGLAGKGYTKIAFKQKKIDGMKYFYQDSLVEAGRNYCYRIVAEFAKLSAGGNPYNIVESLASNETCVQINRDIPLLTNADVKATSTTDGKIEVRWSRPLAKDLDTLMNPGPYRYQVLRSTGIGTNNFTAVPEGNFTVNTFWQAVDTVFTDSVALNTVATGYTYKVQFFVKGSSVALGETQPGSSVFLKIASSDKINILSWNLNVPWQNYLYTIYRQNALNTFDSIGYSLTTSYSDKNLINGISYCYKVKSTGTYGIAGVLSPLINYSQENCGIPLDTVPPCPPTLTVSNNCTDNGEPIPEELFKNILSWQNIQGACTNSQDAVKYKVYFRAPGTSAFEAIAEIDSSSALLYVHKPNVGIAGCYYITAVDSIGNESRPGNIVCVDNCPLYVLPNTFTPNGDNKNDLYKPRFKRFISSIEIQIFNRWGGLVYKGTNPDINWNGTDLQGKPLDEGVYYYTCSVNPFSLGNSLKIAEPLSGFIHIIRGEN
ncbi:MAG TPA: gliding motility-associated C-terminal domain-containing protein, partial [Saprospiraceae bacterium]|nr:gliding motility-associated C-terminal domain-containing protein [Saprospiraceae bacterium]